MNIKIRILYIFTFCILVFQTCPAIAKDLNAPISDLEMYQQILTEKATENQSLTSQTQKVDIEKEKTLLESIKVKGNSSNSNLNEHEPNNKISQANSLPLNEVVGGTITDAYYDLDYFKITIPQVGDISILGSMGSTTDYNENQHFILGIEDSNGNSLGYSDFYQGTNGFYGQKLAGQIQPGTYYIVALQGVRGNDYVGDPYAFIAGFTPSSTDIHPTSVSLNKTSTTLVVGNTEQLVATVSPSNATNKNVTWTSSNPTTATVDSTGEVTALNSGQTTITVCTIDGCQTAYCDISVTESTTTKTVKALSADPTSLNLSIGEIENIALTATYSDNTTEDVTELATWTSSKPSVASVDFDGYVEEVTGLTGGSTTITARFGGKTATINVRVKDDETSGVVDVIVQPSTVSVALGKTQAVKIYAVYDDDSKVDVTNSVTLESYDDSIATVTGALIKGVSQGETSVSGSYDGFDIDITVNVTMPVKKLTVDPASLNISIDQQSDPIILMATFTDSSEDDVTEAASWTSSNNNVATVDVEEGIVTVTGITKGTATITGSYGGKKVTVKVKVTPLMVDLLVQPESVSVVKGKPFPVKIYAVYEDDSKEDVSKFVKLESADEEVAKVTGTTIKGIDIGETVVSGEYNDLPIEIYVIVTPPLKSLAADTTVLDLSLDQTEYITLTANYTDGSEEDVTGLATWTSSKPNIVSLDVDTEEGTLTVTGAKKGTSTITGSYGGKKVMIKVNVTE